jgi:hypothetical protein
MRTAVYTGGLDGAEGEFLSAVHRQLPETAYADPGPSFPGVAGEQKETKDDFGVLLQGHRLKINATVDADRGFVIKFPRVSTFAQSQRSNRQTLSLGLPPVSQTPS